MLFRSKTKKQNKNMRLFGRALDDPIKKRNVCEQIAEEPRHDEVTSNWENLFVISGFRL